MEIDQHRDFSSITLKGSFFEEESTSQASRKNIMEKPGPCCHLAEGSESSSTPLKVEGTVDIESYGWESISIKKEEIITSVTDFDMEWLHEGKSSQDLIPGCSPFANQFHRDLTEMWHSPGIEQAAPATVQSVLSNCGENSQSYHLLHNRPPTQPHRTSTDVPVVPDFRSAFDRSPSQGMFGTSLLNVNPESSIAGTFSFVDPRNCDINAEECHRSAFLEDCLPCDVSKGSINHADEDEIVSVYKPAGKVAANILETTLHHPDNFPYPQAPIKLNKKLARHMDSSGGTKNSNYCAMKENTVISKSMGTTTGQSSSETFPHLKSLPGNQHLKSVSIDKTKVNYFLPNLVCFSSSEACYMPTPRTQSSVFESCAIRKTISVQAENTQTVHQQPHMRNAPVRRYQPSIGLETISQSEKAPFSDHNTSSYQFQMTKRNKMYRLSRSDKSQRNAKAKITTVPVLVLNNGHQICICPGCGTIFNDKTRFFAHPAVVDHSKFCPLCGSSRSSLLPRINPAILLLTSLASRQNDADLQVSVHNPPRDKVGNISRYQKVGLIKTANSNKEETQIKTGEKKPDAASATVGKTVVDGQLRPLQGLTTNEDLVDERDTITSNESASVSNALLLTGQELSGISSTRLSRTSLLPGNQNCTIPKSLDETTSTFTIKDGMVTTTRNACEKASVPNKYIINSNRESLNGIEDVIRGQPIECTRKIISVPSTIGRKRFLGVVAEKSDTQRFFKNISELSTTRSILNKENNIGTNALPKTGTVRRNTRVQPAMNTSANQGRGEGSTESCVIREIRTSGKDITGKNSALKVILTDNDIGRRVIGYIHDEAGDSCEGVAFDGAPKESQSVKVFLSNDDGRLENVDQGGLIMDCKGVVEKETEQNKENVANWKAMFVSEGVYVCPICRKQFLRRGSLKTHMEIHKGTKRYVCEVCGKMFSFRGALRRHCFVHSKRRPYTCDFCSKTFAEKGNLAIHIAFHIGLKPYTCDDCKKSFTTRAHFVSHYRQHSGDRPYVCRICNGAFVDSSILALHLRKHTGETPYHCGVCGKGFPVKGRLDAHVVVHSGVKAFSCHICGSRYSRKEHLSRHERTHRGEKAFLCYHCGKDFSRNEHLQRHERLHVDPRKKKFHISV